MKMKIKSNWRLWSALSMMAVATVSCTPDEADGTGNGLVETQSAAFTVTQTDAAGNHFRLDAQNRGFIGNQWEIEGQPAFLGEMSEEVFFPDAGTYNVTHRIAGIGGVGAPETQQIHVATSDPVAGNIVVNGKFEGGSSPWQTLQISAGGASWTFEEGKATVTASGWNQAGIFQPIQVVGGRSYKVDMRVMGSGATNTWFEVYVSDVAPVQGTDYTAGGRIMGLSTWDGCANSAFDGLLSNVGCVGSGNIVTFPNDGTVYLVIKCGGENAGSISITNVEMRGQQ